MKVLLLTGIKEELRPILESHPFEFIKDHRVYRSRAARDFFATTTGPHLKRRKELKSLLRTVFPDVIINAGLVGILRDDDTIHSGELLRIGSVVDAKTKLIYPGGPGSDRLVTVAEPVFQPYEKMNLAIDYDARACDMEASLLLQLVADIEELSCETSIVFCKVASDKPADYKLYENEHLIRDWENLGKFQRLKRSLTFPGGIGPLLELRERKNLALQSLSSHLLVLVSGLLGEAELPEDVDSVFIPH